MKRLAKVIRCYSDLSKLKTYDERFKYLKLNGSVGAETFGLERYLNQFFYSSSEWKSIRDQVIIRDNACDLGVPGYEITGYFDPATGKYHKPEIYIHHMNSITMEDIENRTRNLLDPEFMICVTFNTHNAIHYGSNVYLDSRKVIERRPNDTCPWKK